VSEDHLVRDHILDLIVGEVQGAGTKSGPWGPPCSSFYLLHYAIGDHRTDTDDLDVSSLPESLPELLELGRRMAARAHPSRDHLLGLWRATLSGVEQLPIELGNAVTVGETRGAFFENAMVRLWIDSERSLAHVDWVYGPLCGRGLTYSIERNGASIELGVHDTRWIS